MLSGPRELGMIGDRRGPPPERGESDMSLEGITVFHYVYVSLWLFFAYSFAGVVVEMLYCWTIE